MIDSAISLFSIVSFTVGLSLAVDQYMKKRYRHLLIMSVICIFLLLWSIIQLSCALIIFYDVNTLEILFLLNIYLFIPIGFCISLFVDSITRESVDPFKITILNILSSAVIIASLIPGSHEVIILYNNTWYINTFIFFRITISILIFVIGIMFVYYLVRMHMDAPKNLKYYSKVAVIGGVIMGVVAPLTSATGLTSIIPGIHILTLAIGGMICVMIFTKQPKLAYILPFKTNLLAVIETQGGLQLFIHSWDKIKDLKEDIFTGMMHAISRLLEVHLKKGTLREISLEGAVLLIKRAENYPIASVLVASKSSRLLKESLNTFNEKFIKEFSKFFGKFTKQTNFDPARHLVDEYFPFIPEYD